MEFCRICNSEFKKYFKSDPLKSVKHLEKLNQYYFIKCNIFMPLSDKSNHLSSDHHKNETKQQHYWCEDCGNDFSDKTRAFQSESHHRHQQSNRQSSRSFAHNSAHYSTLWSRG